MCVHVWCVFLLVYNLVDLTTATIAYACHPALVCFFCMLFVEQRTCDKRERNFVSYNSGSDVITMDTLVCNTKQQLGKMVLNFCSFYMFHYIDDAMY